ncbi:hypothetical protein DT070_11240 [Polaromonas sp. SP1]|nr:hypothetical protein DT070_11240 [Polaromonas sp. SP1]
MPAIQPESIFHRVFDQMSVRILQMTAFLSADEFTVLRWKEEIDKLSITQPGMAALCAAYLDHMMGDIEAVESHLSYAVAKGIPRQPIVNATLTSCCNLLFATKALKVFRAGIDIKYQNIGSHIQLALSCGGFQHSLYLLKQAEMAKLDLLKEGMSTILPEAASVLGMQGISDDDCAKVLDAAGEVMRSRRVFWQGSEPRYVVNRKEQTVAVRLWVDVSAAEAADMTMETADKLIERHLDGLPYFVSFVGTRR